MGLIHHRAPLLAMGLIFCSAAAPLHAEPQAAASQPAAHLFEDVTAKVGLEGLSHVRQRGVSWVDYNNDGYVDVYAYGRMWRNVQGQRFEPVDHPPQGVIAIWVDLDNDGYPDAVTWANKTGAKVYRNLQGQGFELVENALPELPMINSEAMSAGDLDNDGLVDLYIAGYEDHQWPPKRIDPDVILRNQGQFKFEIVQERNKGLSTRGITMADYNEDGHLDIYVSNYRLLINQLLVNNGQGGFTDVGAASGTGGDRVQGAYGHTIGSSWGDLDNDGHLDLFVGNFSHRPAYQDRPKFLRNLGPAGEFKFKDLSAQASLIWRESYASPSLGDFDNDGLLDLFYTTVYKGDQGVMYRNLGDFKFENITAQTGITVNTTYQNAWADFDNDGHLDLITNGRLYRNLGTQGNWLHVKMIGGQGVNHQAIGAQVRISLGQQTLTRQVETATGMNNQNDSRLHFGLGEHTGPVQIHVRWPGGDEQTFDSPVNRIIRIQKGESQPR